MVGVLDGSLVVVVGCYMVVGVGCGVGRMVVCGAMEKVSYKLSYNCIPAVIASAEIAYPSS